MEDSRIYLLTGAAGFLGNNIARQLVEKDAGCEDSCCRGIRLSSTFRKE